MRLSGYLCLAMCIILAAACNKGARVISVKPRITMGIPAGWRTLNPAKQSTFMASEILCNVFEPLVEYGVNGRIQPRLAASWNVSKDLRQYTFKLDQQRRFSNGQRLTSQILKRSLEHSLQGEPDSAKHSAMDLLYRLEDFESFADTKTLSGISTPDDATIVFQFRSPMRTALDYLSGVRYAAYILGDDGSYLGTGPYQFTSIADHEVVLEANSHHPRQLPFGSVRIIGISSNEQLVELLCSGALDVYWTPAPEILPECADTGAHSLNVASGAIVAHWVLAVNGNPGELLEDQRLRKALQYVIMRNALPHLRGHVDERRINFDPQYLLPIVPGRLDPAEADTLINEGRLWVDELVQETQRRPIRFTPRTERDIGILNAIKEAGIRVQSGDSYLTTQAVAESHYHTHDYDLLSMGFGFAALDPDNLYHSLGEHGAITAPPIGRLGVWQALENGRSIVDEALIHGAYQALSRAILDEVPTIHIAYIRAGLVYNNTSIALDGSSMNSYRFDISQLQPVTTP